MTSYYSSVFLEQFSHLGLRQPHGFFLQTHIDLGLSVFSLVYDNLVLVHFFTLFHGANIGNNSGNDKEKGKIIKKEVRCTPCHSISREEWNQGRTQAACAPPVIISLF